MSEINYEDIIYRIGYFRNKANLSAREVSMRLGHNPHFLSTIENKKVELKVSTLLDFCTLVDITPQDFFYLGKEFNKEDKNLLELFGGLSKENKELIISLMKKLK